MRGANSGRLGIPDRTRKFAVSVIRFYRTLPPSVPAKVIGRQLLRSATSVGAHTAEARRSRSYAEMISKSEVALQELDETAYWLDLLVESGIMSKPSLYALREEVEELIAILVTSVRTMKRAHPRRKRS